MIVASCARYYHGDPDHWLDKPFDDVLFWAAAARDLEDTHGQQ